MITTYTLNMYISKSRQFLDISEIVHHNFFKFLDKYGKALS